MGGAAVASAAPKGKAKGKKPGKRPGKKRPAKSPQGPVGIQAAAWRALYARRYAEARRHAGRLAQSAAEAVRMEALHCLARCDWAAGTAKSQADARRAWSRLARASTLNAHLQRLRIAKALTIEKSSRTQAIGLLEQVLRSRQEDTCTAEAAIELARLYAAAKRRAEAAKALDFARSFLQYQAKRELSAAQVAPFLEAAQKAKANLNKPKPKDTSAAQKLFERAEKLRKGKKFAPAMQAYAAVAKKYPTTVFAHRSLLHIGHCLVGLKQYASAGTHWAKFIELAPAGPWRGQAFVGLIDLCLDELFDGQTAVKYAALAESSRPGASRSKTSKSSWQRCGRDVSIRLATVALLRGDSAKAASLFADARRRAGKGKWAVKRGLDQLAEMAKSGRRLTPKDLSGPRADARADLLLAIATIHLISRDLDKAQRIFDRVLSGKAGRPSPAQRSYASYGLGRVRQDRHNRAGARRAYQEALKLYPDGSWHEETLFRLARICEAEAKPDAQAAKAPKAKPDPLAATKRAKARDEAIQHYIALLKRFPKTRHRETALYSAGTLLLEAGQWRDAVAILDRFVEAYPASRYTGRVCVQLIDFELERLFDLELARSHAEIAVAWARKHRPKPGGKKGPAKSEGEARSLVYDIYIRAGLVAYVLGEFGPAADQFQRAKAAAGAAPGRKPSWRRRMLDSLTQAARNKRPVIPKDARSDNSKDKTTAILSMGSIYLTAGQYEQALTFFSMAARPGASPLSAQRAYALFGRGRALQALSKLPDAKAAYEASLSAWAKASWHDETLYRIATLIQGGAVAAFGPATPSP